MNSVSEWMRSVVVQNERDSQVLALSEPRLRSHPENETHVVMMLQRLDKVKRTKRVLAFSLNRTDRDVHDLAWFQKEVRRPSPPALSTASASGESLFAHTSRRSDQVFRSEQLNSSNQYMRSPSVELLPESTKAPFSCWRDFVFVPFPRATSSVVLQPQRTTPEASFVDTILSSYHRFQAQCTVGQCRLSSPEDGRYPHVLQTRTHQVDNSSPWQQEVNRLQNQ